MIARHPKPVILGVLSQYAVMPLVGWSVANLLPLSPELKVGIILIGCVPGGTTSNVVSYLAKGNTALSVSMTAFSTMLAPIITPLLTLWLAGTYMQVPAGSMALSIVQIVLLPVGAGLACNVFFHKQVARIQPAMPWVSVVAIAAVVAAVASKSQPLIATAGPLMFAAIALENATGYALGYAVARAFGVSRADRRTIGIEVGLQNAGLGSTLALQYLSAAVAAPCAVATFWHTITGSLLAMYWRLRGSRPGGPARHRARAASSCRGVFSHQVSRCHQADTCAIRPRVSAPTPAGYPPRGRSSRRTSSCPSFPRGQRKVMIDSDQRSDRHRSSTTRNNGARSRPSTDTTSYRRREPR